MIYPEGNCIKATQDMPFFSLVKANSTIHSNLSVGMPIDFVIYENDSLTLPKGRRIEEDDEYFKTITRQWSEALRNTLIELPECPNDYWE